MKKLFILLVVGLFMFPMMVNADAVVFNPVYNENAVVGGEVELFIPIEFITDYDFTISYDTTMFETNKSMITTSHPTSNVIENGKSKSVNNLFDVTVNNGKITIKAKLAESVNLYSKEPEPMIFVKFKALKAGKSKFEYGGSLMYTFDQEITVKEKDCPLCSNEAKEETDKKSNNDLFLYISLGANAVLLASLVVTLVTRKK